MIFAIRDIVSIHQETGAAWNIVAANYERGEAEDIAFLRAGGNSLFEQECRIPGDLSAWCQRAIHLQCSGGNHALSLLQLGASEVVGVDISERMIAVARRKTEALGARFVVLRGYTSDACHPRWHSRPDLYRLWCAAVDNGYSCLGTGRRPPA